MNHRQIAAAGIVLAFGQVALAQKTGGLVAAENAVIALNIPQQPVGSAHNAFAEQSGLQVVLYTKAGEGRTSPGVIGNYTPQAAVAALLADTQLEAHWLDDHTVAIRAAGDGDAASVRSSVVIPANETMSLQLVQADATSPADVESAAGDQRNASVADESAPGAKLEEIVVTAQKREERLRDVPMSISAFTGESLHDSGIDTTKDLTLTTPGLVIGQESAVGVPAIRGVGAFQQGITLDPGTAVYVDGVYSPRFGGTLTDFADVKRVEVLKGPQVVLYGRNATAGAINFISNEPGNEFGGDLKVGFGNLSMVRVNAALDAPLVQDKLLFRGAVTSVKDDGYMENVRNASDRPGRRDARIGRFAVKYLATENLQMTLRSYFFDDDGARNTAYKARDPAAFGSIYTSTNSRKISAEQIASVPQDNNGVNLTINWDLSWATLTSISAYTKSGWGPMNWDSDSTEISYYNVGVANAADIGLFEVSRATSQETYLAGQAGRLGWLTGAYYMHENAKYGGAGEIGGTVYFFPAANQTDAYAGYGQLTYKLTDKLDVTGGVRYSHEEKEAGRAFADVVLPTLTYEKDDWSAWTYAGSAKYVFSGGIMMYATVSTGFKSGGFNQFDLGPVLNPEKITSYEVGAKAGWFGDRLRLDVSAFKYDYTDLQVNEFVPPATQLLKNAGEADGKGVEVEAHASPVAGLQIDAGLALLDAEFTKYDYAPGVSFAGNKLTNAPRLTFNLGASYSVPVFDLGSVKVQMNYYHSAKRYFTSDNNPLLAQEAYDLLNGRLGFESADRRWGIALFAENITDELIYSDGYDLGASVVYGTDAPRTYGLELDYRF